LVVKKAERYLELFFMSIIKFDFFASLPALSKYIR